MPAPLCGKPSVSCEVGEERILNAHNGHTGTFLLRHYRSRRKGGALKIVERRLGSGDIEQPYLYWAEKKTCAYADEAALLKPAGDGARIHTEQPVRLQRSTPASRPTQKMQCSGQIEI
jgi:hypothetical protein